MSTPNLTALRAGVPTAGMGPSGGELLDQHQDLLGAVADMCLEGDEQYREDWVYWTSAPSFRMDSPDFAARRLYLWPAAAGTFDRPDGSVDYEALRQSVPPTPGSMAERLASLVANRRPVYSHMSMASAKREADYAVPDSEGLRHALARVMLQAMNDLLNSAMLQGIEGDVHRIERLMARTTETADWPPRQPLALEQILADLRLLVRTDTNYGIQGPAPDPASPVVVRRLVVEIRDATKDWFVNWETVLLQVANLATDTARSFRDALLETTALPRGDSMEARFLEHRNVPWDHVWNWILWNAVVDTIATESGYERPTGRPRTLGTRPRSAQAWPRTMANAPFGFMHEVLHGMLTLRRVRRRLPKTVCRALKHVLERPGAPGAPRPPGPPPGGGEPGGGGMGGVAV